MNAAVKELKKQIVGKIKELPLKDVRELYDFVVFLEMKDFLPQIDPSQAYFWKKQWQKMEKEATEDIVKGNLEGPFKSAKEMVKHLKK